MNIEAGNQMKTLFRAAATATAFLIGGNAHAMQTDNFNGGYDEITGADNTFSTPTYPGALNGKRELEQPEFGWWLIVSQIKF